jgi:hypothetical protein
MGDEAADRANELTARFILRTFREEEAGHHLATCPTARVVEQDASNGTYGCDTGCPYARLEAVIGCDCGQRTDFEYGDFGDIADMLEEIYREEAANSQTY